MSEEGAAHFLQTPGASVGDLLSLSPEEIQRVIQIFNSEGMYVVSGQMAQDEAVLAASGDILLSITPIVGSIKDGTELFTGRNLVTGEELTTGERVLAGVGVVAGLIGAGAAL